MYAYALVNPNADFIKKDNRIVYHFDESGELAFGSRKAQTIPRLDDEWELVREPVDFMTAINSGKLVKLFDVKESFEYRHWKYWDLALDRINGKWLIE